MDKFVVRIPVQPANLTTDDEHRTEDRLANTSQPQPMPTEQAGAEANIREGKTDLQNVANSVCA